jgi:ketosteroid isomerase-like protein
VADFASEAVPLMRAEVMALHSGDTRPRKALWSHEDPVTLFGAEFTGQGWASLEPIFDHLATTFPGARDTQYEVLSADASGDLGYVVAIERSTVGDLPEWELRVTTVFRREEGAWRIIHRHADPMTPASRDAIAARHRSEPS